GQVLAEADAVLVSLAGGPDMTMAEINRVMEQINRQCENAHIIMGAGIQEALAGKLSVTLVASRQNARPEREQTRPVKAGQKDALDAQAQEKEMVNPTATPRPASRYVPPAPTLTEKQRDELLTSQPGGGSGRTRKKFTGQRQGQLPLEIVSKGRFEKSEPTIHQGEDLDVPTYIRRGVALNGCASFVLVRFSSQPGGALKNVIAIAAGVCGGLGGLEQGPAFPSSVGNGDLARDWA